jgi:hypothetical protein
LYALENPKDIAESSLHEEKISCRHFAEVVKMEMPHVEPRHDCREVSRWICFNLRHRRGRFGPLPVVYRTSIVPTQALLSAWNLDRTD